MTLVEKTERAAELARELALSVGIRKAYGLSMTGKLKIAKVKPSGATMRETHRHTVRLYIDDQFVVEDTLPNFEAVKEAAVDNVNANV